jgi:hypothetical protein
MMRMGGMCLSADTSSGEPVRFFHGCSVLTLPAEGLRSDGHHSSTREDNTLRAKATFSSSSICS